MGIDVSPLFTEMIMVCGPNHRMRKTPFYSLLSKLKPAFAAEGLCKPGMTNLNFLPLPLFRLAKLTIWCRRSWYITISRITRRKSRT